MYCYWPNIEIQSYFMVQACSHLGIDAPLKTAIQKGLMLSLGSLISRPLKIEIVFGALLLGFQEHDFVFLDPENR